MDFIISGDPKPASTSFSLQPSKQAVANMTLDVDYTLRSSPYKPKLQQRQLTCHEFSMEAKNLEKIIKRRTIQYDVPKCIMNKGAASLYEAIVTHTLFAAGDDCARLEIFKAVDALCGGQEFTNQMANVSFTNAIKWASKKLNLGRIHTVLVLGEMMHIKPESCFKRFPQKNVIPIMPLRDLRYLPRVLHTGETTFALQQAYPLRAIDRRILQVACQYTDSETSMTIYANSEMRFGVEELPAILPAAELIEGIRNAEVHLCPCADIFWRYLSLAREGGLAERSGVVVTGCFGGVEEMAVMNLSMLLFHPVIIVCPKNRPEYSSVDTLAERCISCGASSVRIFSQSITLD